MEKPIIRDIFFLGLPSARANPPEQTDTETASDLLDTLKANADRCVGLAANMIGVSKRIIVFADDDRLCEMFNPEILAQSGAYETEEGCLSLDGERRCRRYTKIKVRYQTRDGKTKIKNFTGRTAQIIQHEMDHCDGIII